MIELGPNDPAPASHVGDGYPIGLIERMIGHQRGMCAERRWPRFTTITFLALSKADPGVVTVHSIQLDSSVLASLPVLINITAQNGWATYRICGVDGARCLYVCEFLHGEYREAQL